MKEFNLLRATGIIACIAGILLIIFVDNVKTSENFHIINDFIQNILVLNTVLLIFIPNNRRLKIALIIGVFIMLFDFIFETIAVYAGWWYPLGGIQFPPVLVLPLEMVISFLIIGTSTGLILYLPNKIREMDFKAFNWLKPLVRNPKFDWFWRVLIILVLTVVSTLGDFTAGPEIWVRGPNWHPSFTFILNGWFYIGMLALFLLYYLEKRIPEETSI
ncbi:MAG: hypothetical protein HWN66_17170 [Candidatus Helarchaeota archaeon]|nr:hypothetical protein [Candidatus Helarchaeota archaeon]